MTFLNATLIFGVAAIAIPLILHLIARRQPRQVVFPSVRFLTKRFQSNRSRLRVRRWWLLALRIAALAAFAVALARPAIDRSLSVTWLTIGLVAAAGVALLLLATVALTRGQPRPLVLGLVSAAALALIVAVLWGGYTYASGPAVSVENAAPVAIAIVLDNSPTSAWKASGDDRIGRMQDLATWMVTRLPATSRIAIIDRSAQPPAFSLDVGSAMSKIESLRPLQATVPIATRIDAATRLVRTSDLTSRQVLVVTDLAAATWDDKTAESGLAAVLSEAPAVHLTVFDLGQFEKPNRSLSIPSLADPTPAQETSVAISTTLELFGGESSGDTSLSVAAELQLYESDPSLPVIRDGKVRLPPLRSVDRTSVRVAAGGSSRLLMTIPPLPKGTHHGLIRLVGDDPLGLDDVRYFSLRVLQPEPVLVVCQDEQEARVIDLAMSDEFAVERIGPADLPVVRLADYRAVVLLDPPRDALSDPQLGEFVSGGGGLLICLGPAAGDQPLLENSFLPKLVRRWRASPPGTFFDSSTITHPLLSPFSEIDGGVPWSSFRIQQYWQVDREENDSVLIRYAGTEHAALVERTFPASDGKVGRLLILTTPLPALAKETRRWNELFSGSEAWPAFLLVRQFPEYLTDRGTGWLMTAVGNPQLIHLDDASSSQEEAKPRRLQLFPPDQASPVPLNVAGDARQVVFNDVSRSGNYWLRGTGRVAGFSANLAEQATRIDRTDPAELDQVFGPDAYALARDRAEIELAESESQKRVSLHSPVMFLALIAFLLEQILSNRFYRATSSDKVSNFRATAA